MMNDQSEFPLLAEFIDHLPKGVREHPAYPFRLPRGVTPEDADQLDDLAGIPLPAELKSFFEFSNGAQLGEYRFLTALEISQERGQLAATYGDLWQSGLIPFAKVIDTGDYLLIDPDRPHEDKSAILDGFHELPPSEWQVICFGLASWLASMMKSEFRQFWLSRSNADDA
jgi:hypothetical protein